MANDTQTVAMTGNDSFILNGRIFSGLADGNVIELTFPNNVADLKVGKNGNTIYSFNATGKQCELKIRTVRGCSDDIFLNSLLTQQQNDFAGFVLMDGEFIKTIGDGKGNKKNDTYVMSGGIFTKNVDGKSNVEGDVDQSISHYTLKFSNAPRIIA